MGLGTRRTTDRRPRTPADLPLAPEADATASNGRPHPHVASLIPLRRQARRRRRGRSPEALSGLWREVAALDGPVVVVHGGGPQATDLARRLGHEPRIVAGRRVTTDLDLDVALYVMRGSVNARLVASASGAAGIRAVGVSGADGGLVGVVRRPPRDVDGETVDFGHVGDVVGTDPALLLDAPRQRLHARRRERLRRPRGRALQRQRRHRRARARRRARRRAARPRRGVRRRLPRPRGPGLAHRAPHARGHRSGRARGVDRGRDAAQARSRARGAEPRRPRGARDGLWRSLRPRQRHQTEAFTFSPHRAMTMFSGSTPTSSPSRPSAATRARRRTSSKPSRASMARPLAWPSAARRTTCGPSSARATTCC